MKWTSGAIAAAAALLASGTAQAQNGLVRQDFCSALNRVVQVAQMDGDFAHFERSRAAPPHFGFRHGCRATSASGRLPAAWRCNQTLAPEELGLAALSARTAACLPSAERVEGRYGEAVFTLPRARIVIEERGGPRAKVGRIVTFRIEAVRP
jgi:hypothetical protein